jgi:hypothetical protein
MAVGIAQSEREKYRFPNAALNHLLIKLYHIRLIFRRTLLFLERKPKLTSREISITLSKNMEKSAGKFREHGWVFVENIFPEEVHKLLVREWPSFYHFHPVRNILKSYDGHFISPDKTICKYPIIEEIQNYLISREFSHRLDTFAADSVTGRRIRKKISFSRARYKSSCVNHLDSVSTSESNSGASMNIIFFVKGTGGSRSGGTCIYRDKNGGVVFEPTNTTNSCLIYRSDSLYHGFPPMKFGKYRWMISCHAQVHSNAVG